MRAAIALETHLELISELPGPDRESPAKAPRSASRERLQALERGLEALSFLNRFGAGTSTQVARALGLKRSTAHRILAVLVNLGLLRHDTLNHQYILCARVGELSSDYQDDEWVLAQAVPRMKAWTRVHHWPLVMVTPLAGKLVVRASTDYESPISIDRFFAGQLIPVHGSTAGLLYRAYSRDVSVASDTGAAATGEDELSASSPEDLARVRATGYVARPTACFTGARVSVPLTPEEPFLGCITMRCRAQHIELISEVEMWVASLRQLAAEIAGALPAHTASSAPPRG